MVTSVIYAKKTHGAVQLQAWAARNASVTATVILRWERAIRIPVSVSVDIIRRVDIVNGAFQDFMAPLPMEANATGSANQGTLFTELQRATLELKGLLLLPYSNTLLLL